MNANLNVFVTPNDVKNKFIRINLIRYIVVNILACIVLYFILMLFVCVANGTLEKVVMHIKVNQINLKYIKKEPLAQFM